MLAKRRLPARDDEVGTIWWTLLGGVPACLLGLELRRVARERAAERDGPHLYARYAAGEPGRPIGFVEIPAAAHDLVGTVPAPAMPPPEAHTVIVGPPHKRSRRLPRVGADHR